jgi:uncharacterized membrane protein AbrB (regulator of aidB expression)
MTQPTEPQASGILSGCSRVAHWSMLIAGSVVLAALLELAGLPAALLLGPMIAGIVLATNGGSIRAPKLPVLAAQAIVGCLVARAITPGIVLAFLRDWPLLLGVVLTIIGASSKVDLSFVMALQTVRFVIVLFVGPPLARFIAQRMT